MLKAINKPYEVITVYENGERLIRPCGDGKPLVVGEIFQPVPPEALWTVAPITP